MNVYARKTMVERAIGAGALVFALLAPQLVSGFWMDTVLTQTFILGIGAASLVFLSAFGGMISLAQAGLMGIAGYALGNMVTEGADGGETKGLLLGWDPTLSVVAAILLTVGIGILFGAVASRSFGIYFLMLTLTYSVIAFLFVSQVTQVGGFSPIAGIDRYTPGFMGDVVNDRQRLYYISLVVAIVVVRADPLPRPDAVRDRAQGVRDEPVRMASLGLQRTDPSHARLRHRLRSSRRSAACSSAGGPDSSRRRTIGLRGDDPAPRDCRDRRADADRGRLARRVRLHLDLQRDHEQDPLGRAVAVIGGSFNTVIGLVVPRDRASSRRTGCMGVVGSIWDGVPTGAADPRRRRRTACAGALA